MEKAPETEPRREVEIPQAPSSVKGGLVGASWQGPLPPPSILRDFDLTVANGAERIFKQFELEAEHRRDQDCQKAKIAASDARIGQALAGLYAATSFGVTVYAIARGAPWVAGVIGGGTMVSGILAFLGRRAANSKPPHVARDDDRE